MKYLIKIFVLLAAFAPFACSSSDDSARSEYDQYGEPFANMPKREDAIIYQVNVRSFSAAGNLNGVREKLSHIKDLGANVIYLMPIYPVGQMNMAGELGSPYSVRNYKQVNPDFGTLEDLRALVDEAHQMDMAVILDWVANHTSWDNPWISEHPEFYQKDSNGNIISPPGTNWNDVAQLDYSNKDLRKAMADAMSYWIYNANIDGFRCDAADYVPQNFWAEAIPKLRKIKKKQHILMLAEGSRTNHFFAGFDYTFGFGFFDGLKKVYGENRPATSIQSANATEYAANYSEKNRIVRYTTNHDVNWTDGTPYELFRGRNGSIAAFAIASTLKSVPMVYNGQEIGYNSRINFMSAVPIDWNSADATLLEEYKKIIAFRKSSDAIKSGSFTGYSSDSVCAFTMSKGDETALILVNTTNANVTYILPQPLAQIAWKDAFTGNAANLGSQISLMPNQYLMLKN